MNTLWIFGDSFSCEWSEVVSPGHREYAAQYNPEHFKTTLSNKLKLTDIKNRAVSGYCNYSILESIGKEINNIKKNDYVVVGWSEITRHRTTILNEGEWTIVAPNFVKPYLKKTPYSHKYECAGRESKLVVDELNSWVNILKKSLPKRTIMWTPFQHQQFKWKLNIKTPPFKIKSIKQEVGINDHHATSESHKEIGYWMYSLYSFNNYEKIL